MLPYNSYLQWLLKNGFQRNHSLDCIKNVYLHLIFIFSHADEHLNRVAHGIIILRNTPLNFDFYIYF